MDLGKDILISRVANAAAAGTSNVNGTAVDMTGWDGVIFIAGVGTLTATQVTKLKAQQGAASDGSDGADLASSATSAMADGDSNKLLKIDIFRPQKKYVRPVLVRGTANAVLDFIIAIRYRGQKAPITEDSTISQYKTLISPAEGTA